MTSFKPFRPSRRYSGTHLVLARLYGRLYGHDCTDSCSSYQRLFGLKSTTAGTVRPMRVSQVTIRLGDAPTHIRRTVSDPLSEAVPCQLSTSSLLDRWLGEVVLVVRAALATRIMHGEHFDSGWSVVRLTGAAWLVYLADEPDDGR